jgi:hypothetical protein
MGNAISESFFNDFLPGGRLAGLAERIRNDDTLLLALRGNSINVYYRGGNILQLTETSASYRAHFAEEYAKHEPARLQALELPKSISTSEECKSWLDALPILKEIMNLHRAGESKSEREFQQLVAWENNRSRISSDTEYFITDIEHSATIDGLTMKADMVGLKWTAAKRSGAGECTPVMIEMKYGTDAFATSSSSKAKGSGIKDHFNDFCTFFGVGESGDRLATIKRVEDFRKSIALQFQQLWQLKLIRFNESQKFVSNKGLPNVTGDPEVIFLLANNNPRSTALDTAIRSIPDTQIEAAKPHFDLRFFASSFAGYGMHDACMLTRDQILSQLKSAKTMALSEAE